MRRPLVALSLLLASSAPLCRALLFTVRLAKPLGIVLEETADGRSAVVSQVLGTGSAAKLDGPAAILPGDELVVVSGVTVSELEFDDTMGAVADAPSPVELRLSRDNDDRVRAVRWPNGAIVGAAPGDSLADLATLAQYRVSIACGEGQCGECELFRSSPRGDGMLTPVRVCRARVPKRVPRSTKGGEELDGGAGEGAGSEALLELFESDDEAAVASVEALQEQLRAELEAGEKKRGLFGW